MKHPLVLAFATVSLSLLAPPSSSAQQSFSARGMEITRTAPQEAWRDSRGRTSYAGERLLRDLRLTHSQERRIRNILRDDRRTTERLRSRLYERERVYAQLERRGDRRARRVLREIHSLQEKLAESRWRTRTRIVAVLSPHQREQLARYERGAEPRGRGRYDRRDHRRDDRRYDRRDDRRYDRQGDWLDLLSDATYGR